MKLLIVFFIIILILIYFTKIYEGFETVDDIVFIHIGKTGGTTIESIFRFGKKVHIIKPKFIPGKKYIISIRNPLHRYVSAFNMWSTVINKPPPNSNNINNVNINNFVIDNIVYKRKDNTGYYVSKDYDELIRYFKTPNSLAESLSSSDPVVKKKAIELFNSPKQHIHKNISWYLDNGEFIKKNHKNIIYVTKQETLDDDIENLKKILKTNGNKNLHDKRVNNYKTTYLSQLAIKNLKELYKDTEYKTLETLHIYGFIDKEYLEYCYTYNK
jgi:hypothetical protein